MAGKWHINAADVTLKALPFGRLVQAYTRGYERDVATAPSLEDVPQASAWQQGQADAAAGLNPGFTAEVAPTPPPEEPRHKRGHHHK